MIRILHIVNALNRNGTETFIMNIFRHIDTSKYKFDFLVATNEKNGFYNEIIDLGGKIFTLPSRREGFVNYHRNLNSFFKSYSHEYDVIHVHNMSLTTLAPLYYAKKYGIKKRIFHIHASNCQGIHNKILHYLNKFRLSNLANYCLSCSRPASKWGFSYTPSFEKSIVIPNGIDLDKFAFNSENRLKVRTELNLTDKFVLIHVGSFNKIKNHNFLLNIFNILYKKNRNLKLICIGDGQLLEKTKEKSNLLGLNDGILFLGKREDIPELLSAADIMIMPSLHEGLGISLIEAQASGMPVIASKGVPKEAITNKDSKQLSLKSGPKFWADVINKYINNERTSVKDKNINNYSISKTVSLISNIYSS